MFFKRNVMFKKAIISTITPTVSFPIYTLLIFVKKLQQYIPPPQLPMAQQPPVGQGLLIIEPSRSHSDTPHSVGMLWANDQPDA
jgi:hypothetical protein